MSTAETLGRVGATLAPVVGGLIGLLQPTIGFTAAVRWSVFGIGAFTGLLGVVAVSVVILLESDA